MSSDEYKKLEQMIEVVVRSIPKEREAHELYQKTSERAPNEMTRLLFQRLAEQEKEHEKKLFAMLELLKSEREKLSR